MGARIYMLVVCFLVSMVASFKVEMKMTEAQVREFNQSLEVNMYKCRLIHFRDHRGWSVMATEKIRSGELIMAIPMISLSSFDSFPWSPQFANENEDLKLVARLVYERVYRFDMTDFKN
jgi:hypothetical protein